MTNPGSNGCLISGGWPITPWNRWCYFPGAATRLLRCDGRTRITTLQSKEGELRRWDDPLSALAWLGEQCGESGGPAEAGAPLKAGWIGYLSYDLGGLFEATLGKTAKPPPPEPLPLLAFTYHPHVRAVDRLALSDGGLARRAPQADAPLNFTPPPLGLPRPLQSNFSREEYEGAVRRAIEYIRAGDIFQVNLSQCFTAALATPPRKIFHRLADRFPAWFGAYLEFDGLALLCNSPELFLRITPGRDGRRIITRPIKGTRPRGAGMAGALRDSVKDQAELNMIVDLERNDLGRVCRIGSVKVSQPRTIETHATVYHGVARVEGILRQEVNLVELLRATFPGGSVTGAPKIRAMQIIDELEPARRGPYCGAIGFLSSDGYWEFNIAIRTIIAHNGLVRVPVGGGIVADSQPAAEYEETLVKAKAMFEALGLPAPS